MLSGLARFHPLIEPFSANQLPAAEREVAQFRDAGHFAAEDVVDVSFRNAEDRSDLLDGQDA